MSVMVVLLLLCLLPGVLNKVFSRCDLARELSQPRHRIPTADVAIWVCIALYESHYNTSAVGHINADGSGDHGLFQISDQYWCSPPGVGLACGLNCDQLEDDDIKDDVVCARRIYRAHKRRTGDGFTAWAVYRSHCQGDVSTYTQDCGNVTEISSKSTSDRPSKSKVRLEDVKPVTSLKATPAKCSGISCVAEGPNDPATAWSRIHNDPRFLDEFP